jgi:hypothetical protein
MVEESHHESREVTCMSEATTLARVIVRQIIESGIKDVVISPGSRNAPLSIAFYQASKKGLIKLHVRIDERTAAFFALGIAKASGCQYQLSAPAEPLLLTITLQYLKHHIPTNLYSSSPQIAQRDFAEQVPTKQQSRHEFSVKPSAILQMFQGLHIQWCFPLTHFNQAQCT